jgi:hypothetical protein
MRSKEIKQLCGQGNPGMEQLSEQALKKSCFFFSGTIRGMVQLREHALQRN